LLGFFFVLFLRRKEPKDLLELNYRRNLCLSRTFPEKSLLGFFKVESGRTLRPDRFLFYLKSQRANFSDAQAPVLKFRSTHELTHRTAPPFQKFLVKFFSKNLRGQGAEPLALSAESETPYPSKNAAKRRLSGGIWSNPLTHVTWICYNFLE